MPPESHEHRHCLELFERMSDYIDRELDEATRTRLVRHLRECGHCNVCHETLKRTIEICRQTVTVEQAALPIDFARRLMALIEKTPS